MTDTRITELINQNNFVSILKNELYVLIDEELAKDVDMDCDLIDELVNAIETLEQCESEIPAVVLPLIFADGAILSKRIRNKVNGRKTFMRITALAAAFAIILSGANHIPTKDGKSVLVYAVDEILEGIGNLFGIESLIKDEDIDTSDGNEEESTTLPNEEITEQNNDGKQTETVDRTMLELELITYDGFKTSYLWQEKLDLTGLKVIAVYSDDGRKEIPISKCEILGFNSLKLGEQTVTVKYNGLTTSFKVSVSKTEQNNTETRKITNIECSATGKDIVVPMGTENPAVAKSVKYRYVYSDGTFSNWMLCDDATLISKYNSELLDTAQTITYQAPNGMEFSINVIVYDNAVPEEKVVTKLEIHKMPQAMKYYASNHSQYYLYVDEDCDFSQFEVKVYYDDRTTEIKTLADGKIQAFGTMSTERPSSYSGYIITFAYGDVTTTFKYDVIIKSEIHSYSINERIWRTYYVNDAPEEFPMDSVVVARMNDSNQDVYLDVEVKGYDPNKIGFVELELYYEGEKLCDYVGGYIYGDTGYAVINRPITDGVANAPLKFSPYVTVAKCVGNGKFETYADIKYEIDDNPINDPSVNFESGTAGELRAMGITSYRCTCIDSSTVEYRVSADEYITEFGTQVAKVYLYNVEPVYGKYNYVERWERTDIAEDLSYTITIKEKPSYYQLEAPKNLKINIQDIYTEFYDKVKVYAVYKDGRKEETNDYSVTRYLPSRPTTSSCLLVYFQFPDGNANRRNIYVYSEGYEDSFFIAFNDYDKEYENYYLVGASRPNIRIDFNSAEKCIDYVFTRYDDDDDIWDVEGWDTSTPGEKEAVITYHSPIGDMKATYKYVVISEYNTTPIQLTFTSGQNAYDVRYGFIDGTYEVKFIDKVGRFYDLTDYSVSYDKSIWQNGQYFIPVINYTSPIDNKKYKSYCNEIERVGDAKSITAQRLENGDVKITVETAHTPQKGYLKYRFEINGQFVYTDTYSNVAEVIIPKDKLTEGNSQTYYLTTYIIDGESGEWYLSREYSRATLIIE